jgi:hypothetical protein
MNELQDSRALGLFSIGLGVAELFAAHALAQSIGARETRPLVRGFGLRELGTGLAILGNSDRAAGLWARVGGDVLDLATLGAVAADPWNRRRGNALFAFAAVAGITLVDVAAALMLHDRESRSKRVARRTRIDSAELTEAFPKPSPLAAREPAPVPSADPTGGPVI